MANAGANRIGNLSTPRDKSLVSCDSFKNVAGRMCVCVRLFKSFRVTLVILRATLDMFREPPGQ